MEMYNAGAALGRRGSKSTVTKSATSPKDTEIQYENRARRPNLPPHRGVAKASSVDAFVRRIWFHTQDFGVGTYLSGKGLNMLLAALTSG